MSFSPLPHLSAVPPLWLLLWRGKAVILLDCGGVAPIAAQAWANCSFMKPLLSLRSSPIRFQTVLD
jgi:hypothetical protein